MSINHAIDLSARSQDIFSTSFSEIIKTATYWIIYNHHNECLLNNFDFDMEAHTYKPTNSPLYTQAPFLTVIYIENHKYAVVSPYQLFKLNITYKGESCIIFAYYRLLTADYYHFCFKKSDFNQIDHFGTELDFSFQMQRLLNYNPLDFLTKKEWVIAWLVIQHFTNNEIASYLKLKPDTIKKRVERILGVTKIAIFHRGQFIEVAKYLGWDLFIPVYIFNKLSLYKKTAPNRGIDACNQ